MPGCTLCSAFAGRFSPRVCSTTAGVGGGGGGARPSLESSDGGGGGGGGAAFVAAVAKARAAPTIASASGDQAWSAQSLGVSEWIFHLVASLASLAWLLLAMLAGTPTPH